MADNDRVSKALANVIDALTELKEAWDEQMASYTPQVIISDAPPIELTNDQAEAAIPEPEQAAPTAPEPEQAAPTAPEPEQVAPTVPEPEPAVQFKPESGPVVQFNPDPVPMQGAPGAMVFETIPESPAKPKASAGRVCPLCGTPAADEKSKFCLMCGASLPEQPAKMQAPTAASFCQKCGAEILPGDRFCVGCGTPV